jgi:hypothetical protein
MRALWILLVPLALSACNAAGQGASFTYDDAWNPHGRPRSGAALQADMRTCGAKTGGASHDSPNFKACMRGRGWTFEALASAANITPYDPSAGDSSSPDIPFPDNSAQMGMDLANQEAALNASNAAAEQQNEAAQEAAQQTMNNANF